MSEPSNSKRPAVGAGQQDKGKGKANAYLGTPQSKNDNENQTAVPSVTPGPAWLESRILDRSLPAHYENEILENTIDGPSMPDTKSDSMEEMLRLIMAEMRELKNQNMNTSNPQFQKPQSLPLGLEMTATRNELPAYLQKAIIENIPIFDAKLSPTDPTMARSFFFKLENACAKLGLKDFHSQTALLESKMANNDETINWLSSAQHARDAPRSLEDW